MKHVTHGYLKPAAQPDFFDRHRTTNVQRCKICGCTEITACVDNSGPCWWVALNLCSHHPADELKAHA